MALTDFVLGVSNRIVVGSVKAIGLIIAAAIGISPLTPAYQVRDSGGQDVWTTNFRGDQSQSGSLTVDGSIASTSLANCNTIDGTSTGMLICGTDASGAGGTTNTGGLMLIFDNRYINTSGDTMTGALKVRANMSGASLNVDGSSTLIGTVRLNGVTYTFPFGDGSASGKVLKTNSAGQLSWSTDNDSAAAGINAVTAEGMFVNQGGDTMTGSLTNTMSIIARNLAASTLANCNTIDSTSTGMLVCGTDLNGLTWGQIQTLADPQYINVGGDTMTGTLVVPNLAVNRMTNCNTIDSTSTGMLVCGSDADTTYVAAQGLTLAGNAFFLTASHSGTIIKASTSLNSSGSLAWETTASGAALFVARFAGANLSDCDAATSTLAWDITTQTFSCGTDSDTTYSVGQGLTLAGTVVSLTANHSGSVVRATTTLASSGTLVWETNATGASLWTSRFAGAGLVDCDVAGTSKLLWDTTTSRFSCGTDTDTNTTYTAGKGLTLAGTTFSTNATQTGTTLKGWTTISGATLQINALSSCTNLQTNVAGLLACNTSDYLLQTEADTEAELETLLTDVTNVYTDNDTVPVIDGGTGVASCTDGGFITGNGTNALTCNAILADNEMYIGDGTTEPTATAIPVCTAAQKIQYTDAGNTLTCVSDVDTTYSVGQGLTLNGTVLTLTAAHSGSVIKATTTLASSGTLVAEGITTLNGATTVHAALSGSSLYIPGTAKIRRSINFPFSNGSTAVAVGSGQSLIVDSNLEGMTLSGAILITSSTGVTGTMSANIYNQGQNCYMFSTAVTVDSAEKNSLTAAAPYAVNATCKVLNRNDTLVPMVTAVHTTAAKGVSLQLTLIP